jgi:hydroxymethylpyrimidine/phosphomethylpyrimidine kinase
MNEILPSVLTIAGSDSGGGAGVQADIKTIHACGGYAVSALTSITAQNTCDILTTYDLPLRVIQAQITALFSDFDIRAVKTGMLSSRAIVRRVATLLERWEVRRLVVDPVIHSKGGVPLLKADAISVLKSHLLPLALLMTPNLPEAEALAEMKIDTPHDAAEAAQRLRRLGCKAVLIKGGHVAEGNPTWAPGCDLLFDDVGMTPIDGEYFPGADSHGTGCVYSAAIATFFACGKQNGEEIPLVEAIRNAKRSVTEAIRHAITVGHGRRQTAPNRG